MYSEQSNLPTTEEMENYFRPSKRPILNNKDVSYLMDTFYDQKKSGNISLLNSLMKTPQDTILHYCSLLREAAYPQDGKMGGCGTIGNAMMPYPLAYQFLSKDYQKKVSYPKYLKNFENILHISLLKMQKVPFPKELSDKLRYFVEFETIEGSDTEGTNFAYYYGLIDLVKEGNLYKIANLDFSKEDFLCAPYHGWNHNAELAVDIQYGDWCELIEKRYPTQWDDFIKNIFFKGTDGKEYWMQFYQLTNSTDLEIAQFKKEETGNWKQINLNPYECIRKK